jgi:hypothetical protein
MADESMKVLTAQILANEAAARFKRTYTMPDGSWNPNGYLYLPNKSHSPLYVYEQLLALGDTPEPAAVAALTGSSWVYVPACDACPIGPHGRPRQEAVVMIGDPEETPSYLCKACLQKAVGAISEHV